MLLCPNLSWAEIVQIFKIRLANTNIQAALNTSLQLKWLSQTHTTLSATQNWATVNTWWAKPYERVISFKRIAFFHQDQQITVQLVKMLRATAFKESLIWSHSKLQDQEPITRRLDLAIQAEKELYLVHPETPAVRLLAQVARRVPLRSRSHWHRKPLKPLLSRMHQDLTFLRVINQDQDHMKRD